MDQDEYDVAVIAEHRRELVRLATGILMERYGVPGNTAESALMDWSRITRVDVYELAADVLSDALRGGTPRAQ